MLQDFDAHSVQPQQGIGAHPPGMFDATITHTYLKETKDGQGLMLNVEFSTAAGKIENRYNIYNKSQQAMDIAQKELSALCHAVNIYQVRYPKNPDGSPIFDQAARELRGARCRIEVAPQTNKDGTPNGYVEIKTIFDQQGNAPGKGGAQPQPQPAQQQPQQPMQQQPQGWGAQQNQPQNQQPAPQQNWNNQPASQPAQQPQPQSGQGWSPGPSANGPAPWNK